jgi:hypothetical protein
MLTDFNVGENLSKSNCGTWTDRGRAAPWRIAVGRSDGATCYGVLLSQLHFITGTLKIHYIKKGSICCNHVIHSRLQINNFSTMLGGCEGLPQGHSQRQSVHRFLL